MTNNQVALLAAAIVCAAEFDPECEPGIDNASLFEFATQCSAWLAVADNARNIIDRLNEGEVTLP